ncbi:zinc finger protein ZFAT-like isoform X2 [Ornithodoros turicata]|uniref:zinc finger protein ZFAT-like isoform X2 n=1 Tax=Ornithodoros turicata TaxID=34597 RepID=UPI00313925B7
MDVFICGVCRKGFHDIAKFVEHKNSLEVFGCGQCNAMYHTSKEVATHTVEEHGMVTEMQEFEQEQTALTATEGDSQELVGVQNEAMQDITVIPTSGTISSIVHEGHQLVAMQEGQVFGSTVVSMAADAKSNCTTEGAKITLSTAAQASQEAYVSVQEALGVDSEGQTIVLTEGFSFETLENKVVDVFACSLCQCFALNEDEMINHVHASHDRSVTKGSEEAASFYYSLQQLAPAALLAESGESLGEEKTMLRILPVEALQEPVETINSAQPTTVHLVVETAAPKRRRGRPRKADRQCRLQPPSATEKSEEEPLVPVRGEDGMFHCTRCKKAFHKERHILGHKCMARGDYVDINEKKDMETEEVASGEVETTGEDNMDDEDMEEIDADVTEDFKAYRANNREPWSRVRCRRGSYRGRGRGRGRGFRGSRGMFKGSGGLAPEKDEGAPAGDEADKENLQAFSGTERGSDEGQETPEAETAVSPVVQQKLHWRDDPRHVPVFSTDEERMTFEEHLNRVDLSCVDHLYTQHEVAQEITSVPGSRLAGKEIGDLQVFSCNVCKKVFKTQSHMRLHCLIHTDLKPFTCHLCSFTTNAKGNLYTHMRKHTGNYFRCSRCDFRSCNRSHMAEHEATHSSVRQRCGLCGNDYNTIKSLVNHVRKYHTGPAGKRYLAGFQAKQLQNMAVLHVCHICNRKFKKKVDRDRHLFVHNVPESSSAYPQCGLCGYQASRRAYLENHYRKHRLVYVCSLCSCLHLSASSLRQHLQEHLDKKSVVLVAPEAAAEDEGTDGIECFVAENGASLREDLPDHTENPIELTSAGNDASASEPAEAGLTSKDSEENDVIMEDVDATMTQILQPPAVAALPDDATLESLFDDSIQNSWYLPEPDGSLAMSHYVNIPQELTENQGADEEPDSAVAAVCEEVSATESEKLSGSEAGPSGISGANSSMGRSLQPSFSSLSQLNYKPLTAEVFMKIRETFGQEECPDCGRLFHSRLDLEPHMLTHTDEKPYKCNQCPYASGSKDNLKRHRETTHEGRRYPCDQCDFVAQSRSAYCQHRQKHSAPQGKCPFCDLRFPAWRMLRAHLLSQHPDVDRQEMHKVTGSTHRVIARLGRRTYKCPYCGRVFHRSSTDLQKHIWIHEGIKPFKCTECRYECRSRNNLNVHMLTHSSEKPHLCDQCGKGYKSKAALRLHVRTHGRGLLFSCNRCEYTATQKCHLKRHLETHDIIRKYVCEHCSYSSNTLNYMKVHYSRKHRGEAFNQHTVVADPSSIEQQKDRVYKCLSCAYIFGNMNDMKRHLRLKHGVCLENLDFSVEEVMGDTVVTEASEAVVAGNMTVEDGSSVELVQLQGAGESTATVLPGSFQTLQLGEGDDGTASAVSIIQQIMEQGALDNMQQVTLQTADGESLVALNPETIVVQQQDGQEVVLSGGGEASYVIQYVQPEDMEDVPAEELVQEIAAVDVAVAE